MQAKPTATVEYYALLYVDILNQKEKLKQITKFPETPEEKEALFRSLRETAGVVDMYVELFRSFIKSVKIRKPPPIKSKEWDRFKRKWKRPIQEKIFSDSLLFYMPLSELEIPEVRLSHMLGAACALMIGGLARGAPARGE